MFKKNSDIYIKINSFTIFNNVVYVVIKNNVLEIKPNNILLIESANFLQEIANSSNILFINDIHGKGIIISNNVRIFEDIFIIKIIDNEFLLGEKDNKTIKYNYITNQVVSSIDVRIFKYLYSSENYIFIKKNEQIEKYSLNKINEIFLWQTDISQIGKHIPFLEEFEQLGEVDQFIGVWKNQLIVLLKGGKFIGLDVDNGVILWQKNDVSKNITNQLIDYNFGKPYHPFFDQLKSEIYILQGESFIVFNLENQLASYEWNVKDTTENQYLFIRQTTFFENKIYFTAFRKDNQGIDDTVGVFDIEKKEIIWQYTFDFEKGNFIPNSQSNIQVNTNNIYVLDYLGNLHVFEKE